MITKKRAQLSHLLCFPNAGDILKLIDKAIRQRITGMIILALIITVGGCATMQAKDNSDTISNLSFSYDGKKVFFDRCRPRGCQIQVYDLETGELAAYQSPANERWSMAKQSYDGKQIVFSVMPIVRGSINIAEMQIAVMDTDGKNYRKVTTGPGAKLYPVFSHSGTKVLYARSAYLRKQGATPAAKYDAWEVDLTTGRQTQLTFFKYFYMNNLTYFPDDERFIYYGGMPEAFPGLDLTKVDAKDGQELLKQEQMKKNVGIGGVIVMRKGDALPRERYNFGKKFFAESPLLSKDGSVLIVNKGMSAGKLYLHSSDGNHRLVGSGGSVTSAAISPDGESLGMIAVNEILDIFTVSDGKRNIKLFLPCAEKMKNWGIIRQQREELYGDKYIMIPNRPLIFLPQKSE